jgi:hypothetical protein
MFLPIRSFLDLGQGRPPWLPYQFLSVPESFTLALGAWCASFLALGGLGFLASLGFLLRRSIGFAALGGFSGSSTRPFLDGVLLRGGHLRRDVRACSATVAAFSVIVASAFVMVVNPFCA